MKKYNVVFHRHYEIEADSKEAAEEKARTILSDEMDMFSENTKDFVSATVEEKEFKIAIMNSWLFRKIFKKEK